MFSDITFNESVTFTNNTSSEDGGKNNMAREGMSVNNMFQLDVGAVDL